jgi:tetratricopeptide (TPR) repeat protein
MENMSRGLFRFLLLLSVVAWSLPGTMLFGQSTDSSSQSTSPQNPSSRNSSPKDSSPASSPSSSSDENAVPPSDSKPAKAHAPDLAPPRSDRVNADDLGGDVGESSSKDTQVDLSAPENDAKAHPKSAEAMGEAESATGGVAEFHPWDPHKAAKSVEVGDFYFKRKNYRAAEDRYREALYYKDDDAVATFRLAACLEKLARPDDALAEYQSYLKILPYGPQAGESKKAIERLKGARASAK